MTMSSTISLAQANFLSFAVEGILYGAHVIIFTLAVSVLILNRKQRSINTPLLVAICLLFSLCTAHFALVFGNVYQGLMVKGKSIEFETPVLIAADTIFSITDCVGQLILIYRCWLVWGKRFPVIFIPLLMSLTALGCGMAGIGILCKIDPTAPLAPAAIVPLGKVAFGLPLGVNTLVTGLIIGRIWYITRGVRRVLPSKTTRAIAAIVVESGALVVIAQLAFVVLFVTRSPGQNIAVSLAEQFFGIAPTLLILHVGMGKAVEEAWTADGFSTHESATATFRIHTQKSPDVELGAFAGANRLSSSSKLGY